MKIVAIETHLIRVPCDIGAAPTAFLGVGWSNLDTLLVRVVTDQGGDYVRTPGWIVRIFDPDATAGQSCQWSFAGAVLADADPRQFVAATQHALQAGATTVAADCRELRIVVPSNPSDPKAVAGQVTVTRTSPNGSQVSVTVAPQDRLVIGFGDSFTSGEGNPERLALFSGKPWTGGNLPARDVDPVSLAAKDTRAQWTDRWCHRSIYSWQIRTALDAALSDPRQSFTILPYGCSGATIMEGVLYGYNGVEWSAVTDKGVSGSRSEIGLAYQEICQPSAFRSYCASGAPWCGRTDPDARSHPPVGEACFTTQDLFNLRCAPDAESMHVPRTGPLSSACPGDPAAFLPFPPGRFEPYRSRTRLFRTMNDVFLAINQRPQNYLDQSPFGVLDLSGRATGGAFHPTAEGHAIIANETTTELCQRIGCGH